MRLTTVPRARQRAFLHAFALLSSLLAILAAAVTLSWPDTQQPAPPSPANDPELQMKVREIASLLHAPCCPHLTVSQHNSPETLKMKREIAGMIQQGMSKAAIIGEMKARYGEVVAPAMIPALWKPYLLVGGPLVGLGLLALVGKWILNHEKEPTVLHVEGPAEGGTGGDRKAA